MLQTSAYNRTDLRVDLDTQWAGGCMGGWNIDNWEGPREMDVGVLVSHAGQVDGNWLGWGDSRVDVGGVVY